MFTWAMYLFNTNSGGLFRLIFITIDFRKREKSNNVIRQPVVVLFQTNKQTTQPCWRYYRQYTAMQLGCGYVMKTMYYLSHCMALQILWSYLTRPLSEDCLSVCISSSSFVFLYHWIICNFGVIHFSKKMIKVYNQ